MNKSQSIKKIDRTNSTYQTKFRLNEISEIKNYFNQKIKEKKLNSKRLSKYVATFDYIDKILTVFSATSGGISIIGAPVGIASASLNFVCFSLTTEMIKKLLSITRNITRKA